MGKKKYLPGATHQCKTVNGKQIVENYTVPYLYEALQSSDSAQDQREFNYRANPAITSCGTNPGLGGVNGVLSSLFIRSFVGGEQMP